MSSQTRLSSVPEPQLEVARRLLEDEEAKDFIQRQRSQWKELARHPERVDIVLGRMLTHFLEHPDPDAKPQQPGLDAGPARQL